MKRTVAMRKSSPPELILSSPFSLCSIVEEIIGTSQGDHVITRMLLFSRGKNQLQILCKVLRKRRMRQKEEGRVIIFTLILINHWVIEPKNQNNSIKIFIFLILFTHINMICQRKMVIKWWGMLMEISWNKMNCDEIKLNKFCIL